MRVFYNRCHNTGRRNRAVEGGTARRATLIAVTAILGLSPCSALGCQCPITISSGRTWIEYGCGSTQHSAYVYCQLGEQCPDEEPDFNVTGPLAVGDIYKAGERSYVAVVYSMPPTGCSQNGTVQAESSVGSFSNTITITVKMLGPFELEVGDVDAPQYYTGGQTFAELHIDPPDGCDEDDPAYGVITKAHYTLNIECPLPTTKDLHEELQAGAGCDCAATNEWHNYLPENVIGDVGFSDSIGVLTCACDAPALMVDEVCKSQQTLKIGDCELAKRCIDVNRQSGGSCLLLTQTVVITAGWDDCYCL